MHGCCGAACWAYFLGICASIVVCPFEENEPSALTRRIAPSPATDKLAFEVRSREGPTMMRSPVERKTWSSSVATSYSLARLRRTEPSAILAPILSAEMESPIVSNVFLSPSSVCTRFRPSAFRERSVSGPDLSTELFFVTLRTGTDSSSLCHPVRHNITTTNNRRSVPRSLSFMVLFLPNVKEHATLAAGASVDHGVDVGITEDHANRTADRGCCVSSCSP